MNDSLEKMYNSLPRRSKIECNVAAEIAIQNAVFEVEKLGADPKLTDIVVALGKVKDQLSDFVDSYTLVQSSKSGPQ